MRWRGACVIEGERGSHPREGQPDPGRYGEHSTKNQGSAYDGPQASSTGTMAHRTSLRSSERMSVEASASSTV